VNAGIGSFFSFVNDARPHEPKANKFMNFLLLIRITFSKCIKRNIYCKYNQLNDTAVMPV